MARFLDACLFTPTLGGTTDWVVSAAVQGFMTPASANAVNTGVYKYRAESADLSQWEIGEGVYTVGSVTLTRATVLYNSSGTGTLQSGAGTKINFSTVPSVSVIGIKLDVLAVEEANTFTATQRAQARTNISAVLKGHIWGLTLSTAGSSGTFSTAAGEAADSTASDLMTLGSAIAKNNGAWSLGNNGGGIDTGSFTVSTWYHVYLIKRPDTGVVEVCFSLSTSAPTFGVNIPAAYTLYRRIGSLRTFSSGTSWVKFFQNDDTFLWDVPVADASAQAISNTNSPITLSVPTGLNVDALITGDFTNTTTVQTIALLSSPLTSQTVGSPGGNWSLTNPVASIFCSNPFVVRTNTSSQINAISNQAANNSLYIITKGWIDTRGRMA